MNIDIAVISLLILLALVVPMLLILIASSRRNDYDERQRLAQGIAYQAAYFTLLFVLVALASVQTILDREWLDPLSLVLISLLISLAVFAVICIVKDAYLSLRQKASSFYICSGIVVLAQVVSLFGQPLTLVKDGKLTSVALRLVVIAVYLVITVVYTVKLLLDRREQEGE